jgi:SAM-dependent methyltransferase
VTRRPLIIDSFMVNGELDMLECRLDTMASAVDWFIAVEGDVDHQNHPKPYHLSENLDRFAAWKDKLIVVQASGLPTSDHVEDPWAREWAQRDWTWKGLERIEGLQPTDIVLHGDVDEICDPLYVRNIRPRLREFVLFGQSLHCFAVDWLHPDVWGGTVAVTVETALACGVRHEVDGIVYHPGSWQIVRNQRNGLVSVNFSSYGLGGGWRTSVLDGAGWHFSWLGGQEAAIKKLGSFCHPEVADRISAGLEDDLFYREGMHVDGRKQTPVEIDSSFPRWIREGHAPASWFRPRTGASFTENWFDVESQHALADLFTRVVDLDGDVVEVGCWEGRSTIALAKAANGPVHAVDTWEGSHGEISAVIAQDRDVYRTFLANIEAEHVDVIPHRMGWRDYFTDGMRCRFVHIDAEHSYREVYDAIERVKPLMVPGGILCGDDVHHPPVQQAVIEHFPEAEIAATLWWVQV